MYIKLLPLICSGKKVYFMNWFFDRYQMLFSKQKLAKQLYGGVRDVLSKKRNTQNEIPVTLSQLSNDEAMTTNGFFADKPSPRN